MSKDRTAPQEPTYWSRAYIEWAKVPNGLRVLFKELTDEAWCYFARRPEATIYRRPAVPGEFWPETVPAGATVTVRDYPGGGVRLRECGGLVVADMDEIATALAPYFLPAPAGWYFTDHGDAADAEDGRP